MKMAEMTSNTTQVIEIALMVGLQGSGKTFYAQECLRVLKPTYYYSADKIRLEHPEWDNAPVFQELHAQLTDIFCKIMEGSVPNWMIVIDNTNATRKQRKQFFNFLLEFERKHYSEFRLPRPFSNEPLFKFEVEANVMTTPYEECLSRIKSREITEHKHIPVEVLNRYYRSFQIPFYEEGFTRINLIDYKKLVPIEYVEFDKTAYDAIMDQFNAFDQENRHHWFTLGEHMTNAAKAYCMTWGHSSNPVIEAALLIHDYGKYYTKTWGDEDNEAHYFSHAEVGTYRLLSHLELIPWSSHKKRDMRDILRVLFYVNYHMLPFSWQWKSEDWGKTKDWDPKVIPNKTRAFFSLSSANAKDADRCIFNLLYFYSIDSYAATHTPLV